MLWVSTNLGAKKGEKKRGENSPANNHLISPYAKSNVIVNKIEDTKHHGAPLREGQS